MTGGMPLAFTQEDFLVIKDCLCLFSGLNTYVMCTCLQVPEKSRISIVKAFLFPRTFAVTTATAFHQGISKPRNNKGGKGCMFQTSLGQIFRFFVFLTHWLILI